MKFMDSVMELIFWLKIAIGPTAIGGVLGGLCYLGLNSPYNLLLAVILLFLGFLVGAFLAEKIRRKEGTVTFWSKRLRHIPMSDKKSN